eukprot:m.50153 g.50153  ORF g.50153 m.50153 type:complete len:423 (-) comp12130_c0_seq1:58-1326(-)
MSLNNDDDDGNPERNGLLRRAPSGAMLFPAGAGAGGILGHGHGAAQLLQPSTAVSVLLVSGTLSAVVGITAVICAGTLVRLSSDPKADDALPHGVVLVYFFLVASLALVLVAAALWFSCRRRYLHTRAALARTNTETARWVIEPPRAVLQFVVPLSVVSALATAAVVVGWRTDPLDGLSAQNQRVVDACVWAAAVSSLVSTLIVLASLACLDAMRRRCQSDHKVQELKLRVYSGAIQTFVAAAVVTLLWAPRLPKKNVDDWHAVLVSVLLLVGSVGAMGCCFMLLRHLGSRAYADDTEMWRVLRLTASVLRVVLAFLLAGSAFAGYLISFQLHSCRVSDELRDDANCRGRLTWAPAVVPYAILAFLSLLAACHAAMLLRSAASLQRRIVYTSASDFRVSYFFGHRRTSAEIEAETKARARSF